MTKAMRVWAVVVTVAGLVACSGSTSPAVDAYVPPDAQCTPPATVTYDCAPLPAGMDGCRGQPGAYPSPGVPDLAAAYGPGCTLTFPFCNGAYPQFAASCTCAQGQWACGL